jgi:hypothetical protein
MGGGGGKVEGCVWPHGPNPTFDPTQCLNNLYVYVHLLQFSRAFFYRQCTVIEEKAEMKGNRRLG